MQTPPSPARARRRDTWLILTSATMLLCAGLVWLIAAWRQNAAQPFLPASGSVTSLVPGVAATMDSPVFNYSPGWRVGAAGADPAEPPAPFEEPAGLLEFAYVGRDLLLAIAPGDYWGYFFVTVDGAPANQLPAIAGNQNSRGEDAGYKPLYAPEQAASGQTPLRWLVVHRASDAGPHTVAVEVWRSWGQTPLRGVAVDADRPAPWPLWPGVALLVAGAALAVGGLWHGAPYPALTALRRKFSASRVVRRSIAFVAGLAVLLAMAGFGLAALGAATGLWWATACGVALLAIGGVARPSLWLAALMAALPFAYGVKLPLLPDRSVSIVDLGVLGGIAVVGLAWLTRAPDDQRRGARAWWRAPSTQQFVLLGALAGWALISASAALFSELALREWRTVFLTAWIFGALLFASRSMAEDARGDLWILVGAWLAGATAAAAAGLAGYLAGGRLVSAAEGVARIQGFYDSPNNLALYLDRTLPVTVALALLGRTTRWRLLCAGLAAVQGVALLMTFSKGSLLVAMPAAGIVLAIGGVWLLRQQARSLRVLLWLLAAGTAAAVAIAPFAGAERFQRLFDLAEGTGALRLLLWRSAWQMARDFPIFGVGPDNFLYQYRSAYLLPAAWREPMLNHPHNIVLDWWTRLGIPGLLLGSAWMTSGIAGLVAGLRRQQHGALMVGLLAGSAAALAHGLIDMSYALPDLMLVWVFMFSLCTLHKEPHTTFGDIGDSNTPAIPLK